MRRKTLKQKIATIGGIAFVVYLSFLVVKVGYQSWTFNKVVGKLEVEIEVLESENAVLENKLLYFKTDTYKERVARERLGYRKPGEEVIIIKSEGEEDEKEEVKQELKLTNPQKWWRFFFPQKEEYLDI